MKRLVLLLLLSASALPLRANAATTSLLVDHGAPLTLNAPASSVFVANPDIADVQVLSPTQIMLFGKRTGETTFIATDNAGHILSQRTLIVSQDLSALREELKAALPGNNIKVKTVPNGIIMTGTAHDAVSVADAYKIAMRYLPSGGDIINRIQVTESNQIQIRVRFAEVQRSIDNSLGFNWQNILSGGGFTVGIGTGNTVNTALSGASTSSSGTGLFPRPSNTSLSTPNDVLGISGKIGTFNLNGMIDALAQEGLLTILAEPNLTAMSGETANFLAGGEYPIPVPQGNGTISVQFRSYGISLAFTPTVLNGNRINLHVRPEVSELTDTGALVSDSITVPALITRKAETTVEVASGESFAIAGLVDNSQRQSIRKFPLLGDVPILGALFRSDHFINGQTELVVIITPYIVKPSKDKLAMPTDGYAPPSEIERHIHGRLYSAHPDAPPLSGKAPLAVLDAPQNPPAPAAAPVAPVSASDVPDVSFQDVSALAPPKPLAQPATPVQTAPPAASKPAPAPLPATEPKATQPSPVASLQSPLVLRTAMDTDNLSGGLLVE
ncbi:MAG: type II and III secretion system protein family protein [Alphaproteobacteria bacterium]|nr:type II and III secretion system protein family protein [Alphaproteobacteria bacterium]